MDFWGPFSGGGGGAKWHFSDFEMHFLEFQDFGFCVGPGPFRNAPAIPVGFARFQGMQSLFEKATSFCDPIF